MNKLSIYMNTHEVCDAISKFVLPARKQPNDTGLMAIALYESAKAYNVYLISTSHPDQDNIKVLVDVVKQISGNLLKYRKNLTAEFVECAEEMFRSHYCNLAISQLNEQTI